MLTSPPDTSQQSSPLRRYLRLYRGFRVPLAAFIVLSILQFLTIAPFPFLIKRVFDTALAERRAGLLIALALMMLGLQIVSSLFGMLSIVWILRVSTEVVRMMRQSVFDKLYALSIGFHETRSTAEIHDRVVLETERVDDMTRFGIAQVVPAMIFSGGILAVLVIINWTLLIITLVFIPVVYGLNRVAQRALQHASRESHASIEALSETTLASLRTMRETRLLGAEPEARRQQDEILERAAHAARRDGLIRRIHRDSNRLGATMWVVAILVIGGAGVIDGRLTIGELFSFYAGIALIRQPLDQMNMSMPVIISGREALSRVYELLDTDSPRPYTGSRKIDITGHVSIEHVTFAYGDEQPALSDVSLHLRPGEVVALVGPNGSGKTTMSNLVAGFYKPDSGRVAVDGVGYDELDIAYLRRQFGVLTQDPLIIPGTVRDNITYGRPDISEVDLRRAIEVAAAGPVIDELELGLETRAFEGGPLLSGGQLQRVALARALLGRPKLLILDEPTNHLDLAGVAGMLEGMRAYASPPATILITHDPLVAAVADRVLRLERGRFVDLAE